MYPIFKARKGFIIYGFDGKEQSSRMREAMIAHLPSSCLPQTLPY